MGVGCPCGWPIDNCHPGLAKGKPCGKDRHEVETRQRLGLTSRWIGSLPCIQIVEDGKKPVRVLVLEGDFTAESVVRHVKKVLEYPDDSEWTFWVRSEPSSFYAVNEDGILCPSPPAPEARRYWVLEKCTIYDQ